MSTEFGLAAANHAAAMLAVGGVAEEGRAAPFRGSFFATMLAMMRNARRRIPGRA